MNRVTFLLPHYRPSGGIRHILEIASGLSARGWDAGVRCTGAPSRWLNESDCREARLAEWWPGFSTAAVRYESGSLRTLRPAAGEVIVTYGDAENELFSGRHLRDSVNVMIVLDWLAFDPRRQLSYLKQGTWDAILCSTPFLRGKLEGEGLSAWEVGAGIDRRQFRRVPSAPSSAPSSAAMVLGSQHSTSPNKGWPDVISVAEAVSRALSADVEVRSYGPSPGPEAALPRGVRLVHALDPGPLDLAAVYSACDAWLCTSASEGYGFPSLEAMSCGVPVITYANGGHSAFMRDGENGWTVPVGAVAEAAERAVRLSSDPGLAARLSSGAEDTALTLSWPACAERADVALRAVLRSRGLA